MRLAATILDRAVLEGPCNAKKAFCQEKKKPFSHAISPDAESSLLGRGRC